MLLKEKLPFETLVEDENAIELYRLRERRAIDGTDYSIVYAIEVRK